MSQANNSFNIDDFMNDFKDARTPANLTVLFNELSQTSPKDKSLAIDTVESFLIENVVTGLASLSSADKTEMVKDIAEWEASGAPAAKQMLGSAQMLAQSFALVTAEKGATAHPFTKAFAAEMKKLSDADYQSPSAHLSSLLKAVDAVNPSPPSNPFKGPKL